MLLNRYVSIVVFPGVYFSLPGKLLERHLDAGGAGCGLKDNGIHCFVFEGQEETIGTELLLVTCGIFSRFVVFIIFFNYMKINL